jgi:hypothetical protein
MTSTDKEELMFTQRLTAIAVLIFTVSILVAVWADSAGAAMSCRVRYSAC